MRNAGLKSFVAWATRPSFVLKGIIPLAYGIYLVGFSVSAAVRLAGRHPALEDCIMSDLLSPEDNPRGWLISAVAAVLCGLMLLPTVGLFVRTWRRLDSRWGVQGVWLYGLGLVSVIAAGVSTPFQQSYVPIHVYLAFFAFMSLVAGLGICLATAVVVCRSSRFRSGAAAALLLGAFVYLTYVFFTPQYFSERRWLLGLLEWLLGALIAAGTVSLALLAAELADPQESCAQKSRQPTRRSSEREPADSL